MSIDWKLMTNLRERQRTLASESVARERQSVAESEAQARTARAQLAQQQDSKAALWNDTRAALGGGACSIEHLQQASAWSRTLDGKVVQAAHHAAQAQKLVEQRNALLDVRRQALRAASSDLEKAREMQVRLLAAQRREAELRADEVVDEWATYRWSLHAGEPV